MEDTSDVDSWDNLPEKCKAMLKEIEIFVNAEVSMVAVGSEGKIISK